MSYRLGRGERGVHGCHRVIYRVIYGVIYGVIHGVEDCGHTLIQAIYESLTLNPGF
jgi:hypothetical protein